MPNVDVAPVVDLGAFIAELVVEAHKRRVSSRAESVEVLSRRLSSTAFTKEEDHTQQTCMENTKTVDTEEVHIYI